MRCATILVTLFVLVLIQSTFVECGWWFRKKKSGSSKNNCYNHPSTYAGSYAADYYYGSTKLSKFGRRRTFRVNTWAVKHSLVLFRGKIFEWGLGDPKTYKMNRSPSNCAISWSFNSKGKSRCLLSHVENWTRGYRYREGRYKLFSNNCHHFVNRLVAYLDSNCGR